MMMKIIELSHGPDSPREAEAKRHLAELAREYQERAKPLIDIIAHEQNIRPVKILCLPEEGDNHVADPCMPQ